MVKEMDRLSYSVKEFAEITGLKKNHIYIMGQEGKIKTIKIGKRVLIPAEEAKRFTGQAS